MNTPAKETVRRFKITTEVVVDTKRHKDVTDAGIKNGLKRLIDHSFEQTDERVILEVDVTDVQELSLNAN